MRQQDLNFTSHFDEEEVKVYQSQTFATLTTSADYFGQATVELDGYLFVPLSSLIHLRVGFVAEADDYAPLHLSYEDLNRLKLPLTKEELSQVGNEQRNSIDGKRLESFQFPVDEAIQIDQLVEETGEAYEWRDAV